jgi:hypothetical protein
MEAFVFVVCILYTLNVVVSTINLTTEGATAKDLLNYTIVVGICCWGWTVYL